MILSCQYSLLNDIICNINTNLTVKIMKQSIENQLSDVITAVIIDKLHKKKQFCSYCLIFWSVSLQIVLDYSIQSFTLIICLRVISSRKMLFDDLNLTDLSSEVWHHAGVSICDNASRWVKMTLNMLKKQLSKVCSCSIITDEYKQHIFDDSAHDCKNTIIFLTVLDWWE